METLIRERLIGEVLATSILENILDVFYKPTTLGVANDPDLRRQVARSMALIETNFAPTKASR